MAITTTTAQELGALWRELKAEGIPVELAEGIVEMAARTDVENGFSVSTESMGER